MYKSLQVGCQQYEALSGCRTQLKPLNQPANVSIIEEFSYPVASLWLLQPGGYAQLTITLIPTNPNLNSNLGHLSYILLYMNFLAFL